MLNLLKTPKGWLIASMFAATTVSAQQNQDQMNHQPSYNRGHETSNCQMTASYSAPADFNLNNSWDWYATASFIYWQARQDNMQIGLISRNDAEGLITGSSDDPFDTSYVNNTSVTSPNFTFRPGVKVGIGTDLSWDDWSAYAEYTWFHGSIGSGVEPLPHSTATSGTPNGQYLYPIQGSFTPNDGQFFESANQSWSLKIDFLDLSLARDYYLGTKLTICPFFGARGAWIRQSLTTAYNGSSTYSENSSPEGYNNAQISNDSVSWGIGPRLGFESNWLLGYGTRLIGNASTDVLYTRYSVHYNQQSAQFAEPSIVILLEGGGPIMSNISVSEKIDLLRAHLDIEMGFGWGTYFCNNAYHIDFSATYGFQIFWDQNMQRIFFDDIVQAKSIMPNGNLYIHGLTANIRFDF